MLDRTSLPSGSRPASSQRHTNLKVSVTWTEAQGRLQVHVRREYIHPRYMHCSRPNPPNPPMGSLPRRSCCSIPWDVSFCSIQSSQLLRSIVRHAFPSSLSSVLSSLRLHRRYNGGASCLIPRPSQFALTPLLGRATVGGLWPVQRAAGGPCPYRKYSSPCMLTHSTAPLMGGTCIVYVIPAY